MKLARKFKYSLFSGPRKSGKTAAALASICDHAWNVNFCDATAITVSQAAGADSGVWDQLVKSILPQYMAYNPEMKWVKENHIRSGTKKPACSVTNKWGGISELSLESLNDESEVEERFKSRGYTLVYLPELSNFKERKTFDTLTEALRSFNNVAESDFHLLADTNPADEGEDSWIYELFYIQRTQTYDQYVQQQKEHEREVIPEDMFLEFQSNLGLLEFEIADNIFLTQKQVNELIAKWSHDKDLYSRYILGLWVKASSGAIFAKQFRDAYHVIGEPISQGNQYPEILIPQDSSWVMYRSLDPGSSNNSAASFFDKFIPYDEEGKPGLPVFQIFDEVAIIDTQHTFIDLVEQIMEISAWWERELGRKIKWIDWGDRNLFDVREPMHKRYYHELIAEASRGAIQLQAADKGSGSVEQRVDLFRRLLFEQRMFVSRAKCPAHIEMFKAMPSQKNHPNKPPVYHKHKHIFDSASYGIASECYEEMFTTSYALLKKMRKPNEDGTGFVSVRA